MEVSRALLCLAQALCLAVAEMALLTTDPPWSVIFQGESVTLQCQGPRVRGQQLVFGHHPHVGAAGQRSSSPSPLLSVANSTEPLEGSPLNLSCITQLSPYRPHTVLWYLFYGNSTILQGPITSSEYQVPAVGLVDTGFYSCEVWTESSSVQKWSPQVFVTIKRVPISGVSLEVWPQEGQVMEGQPLVLHCSVAVGSGSISFSWHREGSAEILGRNSSYEIPSAQQSDNGQYYCMASNGDSPAQSLRVRVTVMGVSSLFCSRVRALLLLAALGSLLLGVVVVRVLTARSRAKRSEAANAHGSICTSISRAPGEDA